MPKKEENLEEKEIQDTSEAEVETPAEPLPDETETKTEEAVETVSEEEPQPEVTAFEASPVETQADGTVTVQPVQFASFEGIQQTQGEINKNLEILMDIKLQMTVELGRTELPIKKVLELTRGSIIELEKIAGEPVELYANGKLVAHGEVVVIEDNFGLRITSITDPEERLKGIG